MAIHRARFASMVLLTMTILLGLAASTQASTKIVEVPIDAETEALLLKLLIQDTKNYHKDVNFKIDPNKVRLSSEDEMAIQPYLSELYETESSLNSKLSKYLDRLQERVNDNTDAPKCKCKNVSKFRPVVIKCECASLRNNDDDRQGEGREYSQDEETTQDNIYLLSQDEESEIRRMRFDDKENKNRQLARDRGYDRDDGYWSDDASCGCAFLRSTGNRKDKTLNLRCKCNSPFRIGANKEYDKDDGYWSDDNDCGCDLLRSKDNSKDKIINLRCRCNSPSRIGSNKANDRADGYWTDDTSCGCQLLRNKGDSKDIQNLRCKCNSPFRTSGNTDDSYWPDAKYCGCELLRHKGESKDIQNLMCRCNSPARPLRSSNKLSMFDYDKSVMKNRLYGAQLSDLSDEDTRSEESIRSLSNEYDSLNILMNYVFQRDNNLDLSKLPKMKRKILIKLRDIVPNLRNIDEKKLKSKIVSLVTADEKGLRQTSDKTREESNASEISELTLEARNRLLKIMEQQSRGTNYRKTMQGDIMGVPFTIDIQALAQINN